MSEALDGLNRSQQAAVTHPGGPLLLLGGAGTGKTHTLIRRFTWLVDQDVPAEAMLALAFSPSAAAAMRERLEELLTSPYEELHVSTFGAFCLRLLCDESLEAAVDPFLVPVTPADRLALLLERLDDLTLRHHETRGNPAPLLASFVSRIDRLKEEMISAEDYRRYAEGLASAASGDAARARAERELEFARLYADHDRLLAARGALDFGDLVVRAFTLLHRRPHVRERVSRRFRHVLVDEYQDMNFAQGMLLRLLMEEHRNVTAAGGDDEAVHRLRGAAQKNLLDFQREFPDATVIELDHSHRSGRRILQAAAAVVEPVPGRIAKTPKGSSGGRVRLWRCRSERAQAQAVAAEAEQLIAAGVPPEEICVLVQSIKNEGAVLASALEERAVPARTCGAAA
jgi:DNA helicase II / ATP-dependent DNA helicase PcrA